MKKSIIILCLSALMPMAAMAQSYSSLWKKVQTADNKDYQKTKIETLSAIVNKGAMEREYGQMLEALFLRVSAQSALSPDSLTAEVGRLQDYEHAITDPVAKAIFRSAMGRVYSVLAEQTFDKAEKASYEEKSKTYFLSSLDNPVLLAKVKTGEYKPIVQEEAYSKIFNDDMLHVLGYEAKQYKLLHDFYQSQGNRNAACITALEMLRAKGNDNEQEVKRSRYLNSVDSLITEYGDLKVAGELAIEHYKCLENIQNATAAEKVQYINYAVSKWGSWPGLNYLRNAKTELQRPEFNINVGDMMLLPEVARKVRVNSIRNISQIDLAVYPLSLSGDTELNPNNPKDYQTILKHRVGTVACTDQLRYVGKAPYDEYADSMTIAPLPVGVYLLEVSTDNKQIDPQRCLLHVTNLYTLSEMLPNKQMRICVVDATTGKPVSGAKVRLSFNNWRSSKKTEDVVISTGKGGEVLYNCAKGRPSEAYTYTQADKACAKIDLDRGGYYYRSSDYEHSALNTDRAIYRPGQTVNASIVYWMTDSKKLTAEPVVGKEITMHLMNANYEKVATKVLTTDQFGQASATFDIPSTGLTGNYYILANGTRKSIRVEKYKRPTFSVELDKPAMAYASGDTLSIKGKAMTYSGVAVQNAKVKYSVKRTSSWWWRKWRLEYDNAEIYTDSATTDDSGSFAIRLPMLLPEQKDGQRMYFNIEATATITDMAGESQQAFVSLPLSNVSTVFSCDIADKNLVDSLKPITFSYMNIAGEKVDASVAYSIDNVNYTANTNVPLAFPKGLKSGLHTLKAICGTDTIDRTFILFSLKDKKAPVATHDWFYQSAETFPATIQVGNTDDEHYIYYNVVAADKVVESGMMEGHGELHNRTFNYKEEYGDGITVTYAWINRGHLYTHTATIYRPQPDKKLNVEWTSFRDKLSLGQKERWTMKITTADGKPANAQLMATLYDKSLDALQKHSLKEIYSPHFFNLSVPSLSWSGGSSSAVGLYGYQAFNMLPDKYIKLSHLDNDCFDMAMYYGRPVMRLQGNGKRANIMMKTEAMGTLAEDVVYATALKSSKMAMTDATDAGSQDEANDAKASSAQLRENLAETAFFAPALSTDANGNVTLSFTLPESVTTWQFLGLAHDQQMNSATIAAEAVASKKVMVQPNMPRFVRQGDKAVVATRIFNTTDAAIGGKLRLELSDAESGKVVERQEMDFHLAANATEAAEFEIQPREGLYVCRIVASGKGYSDGEQHYLPVLSDKQMVTTTVPFTQTEAGTLDIDLQKVLPTKAGEKKLTVEYTNNPSWLMIQALPTVSDYCDKSAISLAAAYYATTIANNMLKANPDMKKTIESWKTDSTSLLSALQQNDELKSIILSESPWQMDADNESGQKLMLANYFDKNNLDNKLATILKLMAENQNHDGSFCWWKGMDGSDYVTTSVATMMARLAMMGYADSKVEAMLNSAMKYLDGCAAKRIVEMKKEKVASLSQIDLDYLYLCAITKAQDNQNTKYLKQLLLKADRKVDIRTKAIAAIALGKDSKTAKEYVESIKQYTVQKPDMGRYFDSPKVLYSWRNYRIPTHVAAMEAILMVTPDDKSTISEMQLWLLQQKRTQAWDTPLNSVDAIHAFLLGNEQTLDKREQTAISVDGKQISLPEATAAVGYVKTQIDKVNAKKVSFAKTSEGTSWGAVYGQALLPIADVKAQASGIKVERRIDNGGKKLKVGDKVKVVITITADRDYDFVQVCDRRAACLEPVQQLSGYRNGCYVAPQDNCTNYFFNQLSKGKHQIETEYFVDRNGTYTSGVCTAECAYSPEYAGRAEAIQITINK